MDILIDAFGGDNAPVEVIEGSVEAVKKNKDLTVILCGDEAKINEILNGRNERIEIVHAPDIISNNESPTEAIRKKTNSSLVKAFDLLKENEYSFIGSPSDNADRFVVRLENSENAENSVFAYQSGNEIIVSGEGELQVFDVMGRLVARQYVSGVVTWRTASLPMGVYIFRLNDKSQKIVIR